MGVLAVHSLSLELPSAEEQQQLGDDAYFAGPTGYAMSSVMPGGLQPLKFTQASKAVCQDACDKDAACVGFKYGGAGCTLMQQAPKKEGAHIPERMKSLPPTQTYDAEKLAGKKQEFVPRRKKDMATVILQGLVPH